MSRCKSVVSSIAILLLGACCAVFAQEHASKSVWDGVYSDKQAKRGEVLYGTKCEDCHRDDLSGDPVENPALAGGDFRWKWNGLTLEPLFQRIHRDMPINNAGKLSREQSADLLAYILSVNSFPAGQHDLQTDLAYLRDIRFEAAKPQK